MHWQPQGKRASAVTRVNHGLVEDMSHPQCSPPPAWFNSTAPPWIRDTMGKRLISIDCCSAPRLAFWLTLTHHQPERLEVLKLWEWLHWAPSMETHQGTSRRQFVLQGRWNHLPKATAPAEAAWGRHVCRQGTAACPSTHCSAASLQLSQWEIPTHYHMFRGENKTLLIAPATRFFFLQLWRTWVNLRGDCAVWHMGQLSYFRYDGATCRETAALSSPLGACARSCAGASPSTATRDDTISPSNALPHTVQSSN